MALLIREIIVQM